MSNVLLDAKKIDGDVKRLTASARSLMFKIRKSVDVNSIFSRIESVLKAKGYEYDINVGQKIFTVIVSPQFCIYGTVEQSMVKLGIAVSCIGIERTSESLSCGRVEFPDADFELYVPVIDKMVADGKKLTDDYNELRKGEKKAQLLESLVSVYMETQGAKGISVVSDGQKEYIMKKVSDDLLVRIPVDVANYENRCEELIKALVKPKTWHEEHTDSDVQVFTSDGFNYWRNIMTRKRFPAYELGLPRLPYS